MHSDYELRLLRDIQPGDWIKVEGSDRPALVLRGVTERGFKRELLLAAFDSESQPSSQIYEVDWNNEDMPIPKLCAPYIHIGDVGHVVGVSTDWISPFALTMSEPANEGPWTTTPMVRVVPGMLQDTIFSALTTNHGNYRRPAYHAPIRDFRLWSSVKAMHRSEVPLIHYRAAALSHDSAS